MIAVLLILGVVSSDFTQTTGFVLQVVHLAEQVILLFARQQRNVVEAAR